MKTQKHRPRQHMGIISVSASGEGVALQNEEEADREMAQQVRCMNTDCSYRGLEVGSQHQCEAASNCNFSSRKGSVLFWVQPAPAQVAGVCVCMCVCVCVCVCARAHTHRHACTRAHTHRHACAHVRTHRGESYYKLKTMGWFLR